MSLPARLVSDALFPLHERLMGRPTFTYLDELERSQWLSRDEIELLQARKLSALLRTAHARSPWFAQRIDEAGLDPHGRELALADLRKLPTMDKADARAIATRSSGATRPGAYFPTTPADPAACRCPSISAAHARRRTQRGACARVAGGAWRSASARSICGALRSS